MSTTQYIFGFHAITAKIRQNAKAIIEIYVDENRQDARAKDLMKLAEQQQLRVMTVDARRLVGMVGANNQGVVAKVDTTQRYTSLEDVLDTVTEAPLLLVLDGVQDPHNLGACLRVADAAGVHAVIAPKDRAVGLNATVAKVASGAAETVPYIIVTNLARALRELKERDIWIIGADQSAQDDLYSVKLTAPLAWVLGAEGEGLRRLTRETCDQLVKIPMLGSIESLNVSVASSVCLFESRRQRKM